MAKKEKRGKTKPSLRDEYNEVRSLYVKCTQKFELLIKDLIKESCLKIHSITKRTKSIESFFNKISKKAESYKNVSDITDLSGVRICTYFSSQVDKVADLIRENFTIIPELSVDKRETMDPDRFGYVSLDYKVKLSDERAKLPEYDKYKDLKCEIQIRSILQHAWAEIEHDLGYKSPIEIPRKIRRRFSCLAGLLELADKEFDDIKLQIENYSEIVKEKVVNKPEDFTIDNISLFFYVLNSPIVKELDEEITNILGWELSEKIDIEAGIKICNYFNIKTIQELKNILIQEKKNIITFRKILKVGKVLGKHTLLKGISLFYLGYLLISKQKDTNLIRNYLIYMRIATKESPKDDLIVDLLNTIDKIFPS